VLRNEPSPQEFSGELHIPHSASVAVVFLKFGSFSGLDHSGPMAKAKARFQSLKMDPFLMISQEIIIINGSLNGLSHWRIMRSWISFMISVDGYGGNHNHYHYVSLDHHDKCSWMLFISIIIIIIMIQ